MSSSTHHFNPFGQIARFVCWLFKPIELPADADADFLATSVDLYDLEHRMRQIDQRRHGAGTGQRA